MKTLGYIISKRVLKESVDFVEVVKNEEQVGDPTKPILIVGYEAVKKMNIPFSILDKKLDIDMFWTFSKTENRSEYERDLKKFYEYTLNTTIKDIKYYYLDIYTLDLDHIKKLITILDSEDTKYIFINRGMIYIYYQNYVMGISLEMASYKGLDAKKIIRRLHKNPRNVVFTNDDFLNGKLRQVTVNKRYLIPFFKSINTDASTQ